jgi:hypothetical protein
MNYAECRMNYDDLVSLVLTFVSGLPLPSANPSGDRNVEG